MASLDEKKPYSDWFGDGDTMEDIRKAIAEHGQPERIFCEPHAYMAALVYADKVVCVGYDGNEYVHTFLIDEAVTPL